MSSLASMNMNEPLADAWSRTKRKYKQTTYYGQNLKANNKHLVDTPTQPLNVKQKKKNRPVNQTWNLKITGGSQTPPLHRHSICYTKSLYFKLLCRYHCIVLSNQSLSSFGQVRVHTAADEEHMRQLVFIVGRP